MSVKESEYCGEEYTGEYLRLLTLYVLLWNNAALNYEYSPPDQLVMLWDICRDEAHTTSAVRLGLKIKNGSTRFRIHTFTSTSNLYDVVRVDEETSECVL